MYMYTLWIAICNLFCSQQKSFYHNFEEPKGSFTHSLHAKDIQEAITLHPVKIPTYTYRLHQYVMNLKVASLRNHLQSLQQQIDKMNDLLGCDNMTEPYHSCNRVQVHRTTDDVVVWDFVSKYLYSSKYQNPNRDLQMDKRIAQQDVYEKVCVHQCSLKPR